MAESVSPRKRCAVFGASGGIGSEVCRQLAADGHKVWAFSRAGQPSIDCTVEQDVARAVELVEGDLDMVVVASGFLHDEQFVPEKTLRRLEPEHLLHSFIVNAMGPALVIKHFAPRLAKDRKAVLMVISAKVGSIEDNRAGGWFSYRASKAALNQIIKTTAIEMARTHPWAVCLSFHPGTVDTGLSRPFRRNGLVLKSPSEAARDLLAVAEMAAPAQSGRLLDYAGSVIPF
jgi:NAD(P)-dependent dehydrogenase (short-subunit alcohol dehydrogenase family)